MSRPPKPPSTRTRVKRSRAPSVRRDGDGATDGQRSKGERLASGLSREDEATVTIARTARTVEDHFTVQSEYVHRPIPGHEYADLSIETFYTEDRIRKILGVGASVQMRTIPLVEGTNTLTGRPVRAYRLPSGRYVVVETIGGMG